MNEFFSKESLSANNSGKFNGFTLAEVLITLGIIGVVAAMTLPSLVQKNRNKQLETALKRNYSILGQVLNMYQAETGERVKAGQLGKHQLKPILMKYLNTVKDCGLGFDDAEKACIKNTTDEELKNNPYKSYNGKASMNLGVFDDGQFVTNDGSLIIIENNVGDNIYISIDVNGYNKNPNRLGQDLFMFQIDEKGTLLPMGVEGTEYYSETDEYCSARSTGFLNGSGCTYKALTEKDYFNNLPK